MSAIAASRPSSSRSTWYALAVGAAGSAVMALTAVNLLRWPVVDMGGIVARGLLLALLALQVIPVFGLPFAMALRRWPSSGLRVVFWFWLVPALGLLAVGLLGLVAFQR
ncbi:MAG: hypothetical protein R3B13_14345 [Polyangiaceae bacterium]